MDEQLTGLVSGEATPPEDSLVAARLMREEFGEPTSVFDETAPVSVGATSAPSGDTAAEAGGAIHEEFAEPARVSRARSHRTGMLAGLGVVGVLLAVLVLLSPGSGQPRLPVQSVHDVSPIAASGPKTAAATVAPAAIPSTTSSTTTPSTPTTQPQRTVTAPSTVTYVYQPGTPAPAPAPAASTPAAAPSPTTAPPPPPPTTTTTAPPTTTTTTKRCGILGLFC
jgi:hypothetical protein